MKVIGALLIAAGGMLAASCSFSGSSGSDTRLATTWESVPAPEALYLTGTDCTVASDNFILYKMTSAKAKTLYPYWRGSIGKKNGAYAACGFEGKICYQSGDMDQYGFTMNADYPRYLNYYIFAFDANGDFCAYWYDANATKKTLLSRTKASVFGGGATGNKATYTVKAEQVSASELHVSVNGVAVCTISPLERTEGVLGVVMTMKDGAAAAESSPLACTFRLDKVQYRE